MKVDYPLRIDEAKGIVYAWFTIEFCCCKTSANTALANYFDSCSLRRQGN